MTTNNSDWSVTHIDLLAARFGGQALECNDEFFAPASSLVKAAEPVFLPDEYTDRGKLMDGWETRRRRTPGHDWCILRMGLRGMIKAFDVDTRHFRGNAPASVSIEACALDADPDSTTEWQLVVDEVKVNANSHNYIELSASGPWTHLRLNIFPDGGVARLRAYGEAKIRWDRFIENEIIDLAASENGGCAIRCSDMFFSPMNNIIAPGRGINMGDGWETRRRRSPGYDWLIVKLACAGTVARVLVDTHHFKGNYPDSFSLEACYVNPTEQQIDIANDENIEWRTLLASQKLLAHSEHVYRDELENSEQVFNHVRLKIFPDGGVSRLRIFGLPDRTLLKDDLGERAINEGAINEGAINEGAVNIATDTNSKEPNESS